MVVTWQGICICGVFPVRIRAARDDITWSARHAGAANVASMRACFSDLTSSSSCAQEAEPITDLADDWEQSYASFEALLSGRPSSALGAGLAPARPAKRQAAASVPAVSAPPRRPQADAEPALQAAAEAPTDPGPLLGGPRRGTDWAGDAFEVPKQQRAPKAAPGPPPALAGAPKRKPPSEAQSEGGVPDARDTAEEQTQGGLSAVQPQALAPLQPPAKAQPPARAQRAQQKSVVPTAQDAARQPPEAVASLPAAQPSAADPPAVRPRLQRGTEELESGSDAASASQTPAAKPRSATAPVQQLRQPSRPPVPSAEPAARQVKELLDVVSGGKRSILQEPDAAPSGPVRARTAQPETATVQPPPRQQRKAPPRQPKVPLLRPASRPAPSPAVLQEATQPAQGASAESTAEVPELSPAAQRIRNPPRPGASEAPAAAGSRDVDSPRKTVDPVPQPSRPTPPRMTAAEAPTRSGDESQQRRPMASTVISLTVSWLPSCRLRSDGYCDHSDASVAAEPPCPACIATALEQCWRDGRP